MPITFRVHPRPYLSTWKWITIVVLIALIIIIAAHSIAIRKVIYVNEDEPYQIIQLDWEDIGPADIAHRHFYWPFVIHMKFPPDETAIDQLQDMGLCTFLHSEPVNFAIPLEVAADISNQHHFQHSNDKLMLHSQYPITLELVSNPGLITKKYDGDDENIGDISEFLSIVNTPESLHPVYVKLYPNNFIFVPRKWLFRVSEINPEYKEGLLEVFQYDTPFSRYL